MAAHHKAEARQGTQRTTQVRGAGGNFRRVFRGRNQAQLRRAHETPHPHRVGPGEREITFSGRGGSAPSRGKPRSGPPDAVPIGLVPSTLKEKFRVTEPGVEDDDVLWTGTFMVRDRAEKEATVSLSVSLYLSCLPQLAPIS